MPRRAAILYRGDMDDLVTTGWLDAELGAPDLRILDCTYVDAGLGRDPAAEWRGAHIPGSRFLDLKAVADPDTPLPTMLPSAARFAAAIGALGIGTGDRIVLYDDSPWRTAARGWFMFRSFGVSVAILDGGMAKWRAEGHPLDSAADDIPPEPRTFAVPAARRGVRTMGEMRATLASGDARIVDARSAARFTGAEPDPRPGVAAGHIPGSLNLPYGRLFAEDGTYLPRAELAQTFASAGIDLDRPLVATCGSGVTASAIAFAAHLLGHEVPVYDGSWTEWGADPSTPKATA